jgi:hypothetical protein
VKTFKVNEGLLFPDGDYRGKNIALRFYIGLYRNHKIFLVCLMFFRRCRNSFFVKTRIISEVIKYIYRVFI